MRVDPMLPQNPTVDIFKLYRLNSKINVNPELSNQIRRLLMKMIIKGGICTRTEIRAWAEEKAEEEFEREGHTEIGKIGKNLWMRKINDFESIIIDVLLVQHFSEKEVDDIINLVRREQAARQLNELTNFDHIPDDLLREKIREFAHIPKGELSIPREELESLRVQLIHYFFSNQLPFSGVGKKFLTVWDIENVVNRTVSGDSGKGLIGGKAAGIILASRILNQASEIIPKLEHAKTLEEIEYPESYFISSDVFDDLINYNNFTHLHHHKYRPIETIAAEKPQISRIFRKAEFPPNIAEQLTVMIKRLGDSPLIIRSSSLLEDNFGSAFSGKYPSIFLSNEGSDEERVNKLLEAVKVIYAAVFDPDPIYYRRKHDLLDFDEKMAILVQKVVGHRFGTYYFPTIGGVGFSTNHYTWSDRLKEEDGLLRFVFGLGTRAVDRVGDDYPRMVSLTEPTLRPEIQTKDIIRYSQRYMDVINLATNTVETVNIYDMIREIQDGFPDLDLLISRVREGYLDPYLRGDPLDGHFCLTFDQLLSATPFAPVLRDMMRVLQKAYGGPVDIEYAMVGDKIYILQCRPLACFKGDGRAIFPNGISHDRIIFTADKQIIPGYKTNITHLVYVDPDQYVELRSPADKIQIAKVVGALNIRLKGKYFILMGPGRWGSQNINLGVKVNYADINNAQVLVEIARSTNGYTTEVSFGTHFFQDLVEDEIIPLPLYPDEPHNIFNYDFLSNAENIIDRLIPDMKTYSDIIKVISIPETADGQYLHVVLDRSKQKGLAYLGDRLPQ